MKKNVIAITREFGSMGRLIAQRVADKMNYEYYDRELIDKMAERMGTDVREYMMDEGKYAKHGNIYGKMMYPLGNGSNEKQEKLYDSERRAIEYLALKKNCVMVGRCADYILKTADNCNLFNVHIYAPFSARYSAGVNHLGLHPDAVFDYIDKVDSARQVYYKRHTGESFNTIKNRDMLIDSSIGSVDQIADMICYCAKMKFENNNEE